ncbi:putative dnaJ molecular chaperone homology domain [Lyophyllum shimeji]|uniref:DnaJ molecular chaperone homology domain n=1 Tax=Lyophyllum shimeji TaxID=47721 RepID=A0A9P3PLW6_LYOSH|nr:putative dnaJ molecular chaperone homology domain [Lyophyllum shimeji]
MFGAITAAMPLPLLSLVGWSVVPDFATKQLVSLLHRFAILPAPTTQPTYRKQYALTFAFVVLTYLLYNLIDSARSMPPNFYQILSVHPTVDEQGLKASFRQFAKKNHPDRPGVGRDGEELFVMVRDVYEALKDPVVRFAYDRFGPDVLTWSQQCTTTREYIQHGLIRSSGYHIVVGAALIFWSFVRSSGPDPVAFWRYILYVTLFVAEISLILSPSPSPVSASSPSLSGLLTTYTTHTPLHTIFPRRLIHQHILFLHQLFVFLSVALTRVVPVLLGAFSPQPPSPAMNHELLQNISQLASIADRETSIILHTLLHSIASPPSSASSPTSSPAPPHEEISSLACPRPFELPPEISFPDPRTTPPDAQFTPHNAKEAEDGHNGRDAHPLIKLSREIEELIIEANIKKEDGPLRSAWEAAVRRGRALTAALAAGANAEWATPPAKEKSKRNFWEAPADDDDDDTETEDDVAPGDYDASTLEEKEKDAVKPGLRTSSSPRRNSDGGQASH